MLEEGVEVTFIPVDCDGVVSVKSIEVSLKANTVLVSIMHVNNETGIVEPIDEIGRFLKSKPGIYFHVDGVQGFGKQALDLANIDLYTLSGHKIGAPKGIGLLLVKEQVELIPLLYGGEQESGIRPGTTNVPGVLSLAEAIKVTTLEREEKMKHLTKLNDYIYSNLEAIPELKMNSPKPPLSSPHIINFSYKEKGATSAIMIKMLARLGIIVSSQSACSSRTNLSRVIMAMTHDKEVSSSSIRISLHEAVSLEDARTLVSSILQMVEQIKSKSKFELIGSGKVTTK
ncbi:cysteine desulfurase family protein [Paenibacillus sp. E194]|uniref:cysteine desulfurase family protein n=1 Tax=Paenibacillus sp. E194 TaxID=1458845 RepID=UPI003FA5787A